MVEASKSCAVPVRERPALMGRIEDTLQKVSEKTGALEPETLAVRLEWDLGEWGRDLPGLKEWLAARKPKLQERIERRLATLGDDGIRDPDKVLAAICRAAEIDLDAASPKVPIAARAMLDTRLAGIVAESGESTLDVLAKAITAALIASIEEAGADAAAITAERKRIERDLARHLDSMVSFAGPASAGKRRRARWKVKPQDLATLVDLVAVRAGIAWDTESGPGAAGGGTPYQIGAKFIAGQALAHSKFGSGIVIAVEGTTIEVRFAEGTRRLRHAG